MSQRRIVVERQVHGGTGRARESPPGPARARSRRSGTGCGSNRCARPAPRGRMPCANALLLEITTSCSWTGSRSTARGNSGSSRRKPFWRIRSRWRYDVVHLPVIEAPGRSSARRTARCRSAPQASSQRSPRRCARPLASPAGSRARGRRSWRACRRPRSFDVSVHLKTDQDSRAVKCRINAGVCSLR